MPYNAAGADTIDFFATTYFGPGGSLTRDLAEFNAYIEKVSGIMRRGKTYSDVAVYIPYEDGVMKGAYPPERQRVWVWGEYEMRYIFPAEEVSGYHPLWINRYFLENGQLKNGRLKVGDASFGSLYIDAEYMDVRALQRVLQLAEKGLPVCLKRAPVQPGIKKDPGYARMINTLKSLPNVSEEFDRVVSHPPLIAGDSIPEYWCRLDEDGTHYLFLAQLPSKDLKYPIYSGQSFMDRSDRVNLTLHLNGRTIVLDLEFEPYQSILMKINPGGEVEQMDISFVPQDPWVRPREEQRMYF
jgi:hypothetical protein